jgi:hypothetical protein
MLRVAENEGAGVAELLHGGPLARVTVQQLQKSALKQPQLALHLHCRTN